MSEEKRPRRFDLRLDRDPQLVDRCLRAFLRRRVAPESLTLATEGEAYVLCLHAPTDPVTAHRLHLSLGGLAEDIEVTPSPERGSREVQA